MKLLYITNGINGAGGLERVLSIKASYLADHFGYEVTILVLNDQDKNPFFKFSDRIKTLSIQVAGNPIQYLKSYRNGIQRIVKMVDPDIISVCDDGLKGFFIPKILESKRKIIYERHVSKLIEANVNDGFVKRISNKVKWLLMESLAKNFEQFIVLTDGNKNEWRSLKNIQVVPNPLSFYPATSSNWENKKVICVGKISYQKGQDLLVRAWEQVIVKHPDWQLELYGKSDDDFLNTDSLPSKHIFHFPPERNIEAKYLESSIYVMSSRYEGFGMVLIEAMACGLPCVSFDCNYGPSDIITDNENGILVAPENVDDLADSILNLIENTQLRKVMGKEGRENVKKYLPQNIVNEWNDLLKKL